MAILLPLVPRPKYSVVLIPRVDDRCDIKAPPAMHRRNVPRQTWRHRQRYHRPLSRASTGSHAVSPQPLPLIRC